MSDVIIGLMLAAGVAGWVYNKIGIRSGGNKQQGIATAVIAGVLAFMTMITALRIF